MQAEILSIGDELTSGQRLDTNSQWLSTRLGELGIRVLYHTTVADDLDANHRVFRQAIERADVVVATGGLGRNRFTIGTAIFRSQAIRPVVTPTRIPKTAPSASPANARHRLAPTSCTNSPLFAHSIPARTTIEGGGKSGCGTTPERETTSHAARNAATLRVLWITAFMVDEARVQDTATGLEW